MNRRMFTQAMAVAALSAGVPKLSAAQAGQAGSPKAPQFPLSVMLWTVFTDLPFEERLAKVAEAGYSKIQLVGEYNAQHWTQADYDHANAARKRLGIEFDATAGLHNGVADPATRDAFLAELKEALTPMETLSCPAMIVLSPLCFGRGAAFIPFSSRPRGAWSPRARKRGRSAAKTKRE